MKPCFQVVLCTCPDAKSAQLIATCLVENQLAACVNVIAGVSSVYLWQGKVEQAQEWQLVIKSRTQHFAQIAQQIKAIHPYDVPELIALPIEQGSQDYLQWLTQSTSLNK